MEISVKITMFKVIGGQKIGNYELYAMSNHHAKTVADDFYKKCGLIGRWYCETSEGENFSINL